MDLIGLAALLGAIAGIMEGRRQAEMNLIDAYVVEVLSKPKYRKIEDVEWWEVEVNSIDMGEKIERESLTFKTKEEAEEVKVGYIFQH